MRAKIEINGEPTEHIGMFNNLDYHIRYAKSNDLKLKLYKFRHLVDN